MGYMIYFQALRTVIRHEAFLQNPAKEKQNLVSITLPRNSDKLEFSKSRKKEIRVGHAMYDVVGESAKGDSIVYLCKHDYKEEKLLSLARDYNNLPCAGSVKHHPVKVILDSIIKTGLVKDISTFTCYASELNLALSDIQITFSPFIAVDGHPPQPNLIVI